MQLRVYLVRRAWWQAILVALLAGTIPALARAQVIIPAEALVNEEEVTAALEKGLALEQQRRWGEALSHYEDAVRHLPDRRELQQRLNESRLHFDLTRRYSDRSFRDAVNTLREIQALDLYSEILLKINTYYVHAPDWRDLVQRGTLALELALDDPAFAQQHLQHANPAAVDAFRRELHRQLDWRKVYTRHEARDAVAAAARLGQQHLGIQPTASILEYVSGTAGSLDPYSSFLTTAQLEDVYSQIEGNFVGLGVELKGDQDSLLIVHVLAASPAERGGIRAGDRIVEVNGHSTREVSTDRAADMLKGEQGTMVEVVAVSPAGESRRLQLRRERVEVPCVEDVRIIDPQLGIGYFRLTSFQKTTSRDVDAALWKLHREGMRSLVIDVRGNPGGLLTASVEVADKFVTDGTIVSTRGRSPQEDFDYKAHRVGTWQVPLVVLIDENTASASEIFAGAIRDLRRGTIVGERSYGKGSVQGIFSLSGSTTGVRLTTAKFYSPSGQAISQRGVSPDILVRVTAKPILRGDGTGGLTEQNDPVLGAALQNIRGQVSQR